jgi:hypothetical protein
MRAGQCYRILADAAKFMMMVSNLECHAGPGSMVLLDIVHVVE